MWKRLLAVSLICAGLGLSLFHFHLTLDSGEHTDCVISHSFTAMVAISADLSAVGPEVWVTHIGQRNDTLSSKSLISLLRPRSPPVLFS